MADRKQAPLLLAIDRGFALLRTIAWVVAVIFIGGYLRDVGVALAGKETNAHVVLNFITQLGANRGFAYLIGMGGAGYGLYERKVRRSNIERMRGQTSKIEKLIDPNRTSSGLTPKGNTRKGDK